MVDRIESRTVLTRRPVVRGLGALLGAAAASSFREKVSTVGIIRTGYAQESVTPLNLADNTDIRTLDTGRVESQMYQGIEINLPAEFPEITGRYVLPENYQWGAVDPATVPYFADVHDGEEVPEDAEVINPASTRSVFGRYAIVRAAYAAGWEFAAFTPDPLPGHPRRWYPWAKEYTRIDKNQPDLWAVGGSAHKLDVITRDRHLAYIRAHGSLDGLWGNWGDAPIRAHAEYARNSAIEALPGSGWHISVIGNCSAMGKEVADVRWRLLATLGLGYINLPVPPKGVDSSRFVLNQVRIREDGSRVDLTLDDYFGFMAIIGSGATMLPVKVESGLDFIRRGEVVLVATEGHTFFRPVYAVSSDNTLVRAADFGKAHRNYHRGQINALYLARRNGVWRRPSDGTFQPVIFGGEMSDRQLVERGSLLYRCVYPADIYALMFDLAPPSEQPFIEWRNRLRHPDVRMVWGGF